MTTLAKETREEEERAKRMKSQKKYILKSTLVDSKIEQLSNMKAKKDAEVVKKMKQDLL